MLAHTTTTIGLLLCLLLRQQQSDYYVAMFFFSLFSLLLLVLLSRARNYPLPLGWVKVPRSWCRRPWWSLSVGMLRNIGQANRSAEGTERKGGRVR
uniref:Uncharacterized protein n=1 Tax=Anopheles darlingi TaxID=43151 RepID=A0A2M4D4E9_ANODA